MKRVSMYLLPIAALLLLGGIFVSKWWKNTTSGLNPSPLPMSEGIEIEDNGRTLLKNFGLTDDNATGLKNVSKETGVGVVQWGDEARKSFTVVANVENVPGTWVQAWIMNADGTFTKIGTLTEQKAGYILDYKLSANQEAPTGVVVSREKTNDNTIEEKLLEGTVSAE